MESEAAVDVESEAVLKVQEEEEDLKDPEVEDMKILDLKVQEGDLKTEVDSKDLEDLEAPEAETEEDLVVEEVHTINNKNNLKK